MPDTNPTTKPTTLAASQAEPKLPSYAKASLAALKEAHANHNVIDGGLLLAVLEALIEAESKE